MAGSEEQKDQAQNYYYWLYGVGHSSYTETGQQVNAKDYHAMLEAVRNEADPYYADRCSFAGIVNEDERGLVQVCGKKFTVLASTTAK